MDELMHWWENAPELQRAFLRDVGIAVTALVVAEWLARLSRRVLRIPAVVDRVLPEALRPDDDRGDLIVAGIAPWILRSMVWALGLALILYQRDAHDLARSLATHVGQIAVLAAALLFSAFMGSWLARLWIEVTAKFEPRPSPHPHGTAEASTPREPLSKAANRLVAAGLYGLCLLFGTLAAADAIGLTGVEQAVLMFWELFLMVLAVAAIIGLARLATDPRSDAEKDEKLKWFTALIWGVAALAILSVPRGGFPTAILVVLLVFCVGVAVLWRHGADLRARFELELRRGDVLELDYVEWRLLEVGWLYSRITGPKGIRVVANREVLSGFPRTSPAPAHPVGASPASGSDPAPDAGVHS